MKRHSRMVPVGIAIALLFGCQSVRGDLTPQGVVSLGKASLTLRLPQVTRQVLAVRASSNYRLTITGADITTPYTTTVSQAEDAVTIEASGIPLGNNRIISLEALDSHGGVIPGAVWRAVASFGSARNQVELTAATTAVGRVWHRWLETSHAAFANKLTPAAVLAEMDKIKTANAVSHYSLINTQKWADDAVSQDKIDLGTAGYALVPAVVDVTIEGAPSEVPAELWVDDPASPLQAGISPNTTLTNGRYQVSPVAPGNWILWASVPGFGIASCSINVTAGETLSRTLTFPGWQPEANLPVPVGNSAYTTDGRYIYLLGGVLKGGTATDSCWKLDTQAASPSWAALPPLVNPTEGAAAAIVNNKLYVVGGASGATKLSTACVLDLASPADWAVISQIPSVPGDISDRTVDDYDVDPTGAVADVANQKLVVYYNVLDVWNTYPLYDSGFSYVYDPTEDTWTVDPEGYPKIRTPRLRAGMALFGNQVVVAGGDRPLSREDAGYSSYLLRTSARVEAFDRIERRWLALPDLSIERSELSLTAAAGKLYAAGGTDYGDKALGTVECYNPSTRTWLPGPPLRTPRSSFALVYAGGKLWAIGGSPSRRINRADTTALTLDSVESLSVAP